MFLKCTVLFMEQLFQLGGIEVSNKECFKEEVTFELIL